MKVIIKRFIVRAAYSRIKLISRLFTKLEAKAKNIY